MMRKPLSFVLCVALALLVAGCALLGVFESKFAAPQVRVDAAGKIEIDPNPLLFIADGKSVRITWRLPPESKATFAADPPGIFIEDGKDPLKPNVRIPAGEEFVACGPGEGGKAYSCTNRKTRPAHFKYTITFRDGEKLLRLDPEIHNKANP